jgi:hypothetical protein
MWWASKSTKTHVPILKGLTITQVRDVGGFDIGVMWQSQFKQASVLLEGPFDTVSDYELLGLWRTHMAEKSIVGSISTIAQPICTGMPMYALITFLTPGMPKDEAETLVAKEISDCYAPYTVDITWNPLSLLDVAEYSSTIWAPNTENVEFPPLAEQVQESLTSITCDDVTRIVYDVLEDDAINQEINSLVSTGILRDFEEVYRIEVNRLTTDAFRESEKTARLFRRSGILVIETEDENSCEQLASEIIGALSPKARLRISRMIGRQHLGALLAAGIPAYGWQYNEHVAS